MTPKIKAFLMSATAAAVLAASGGANAATFVTVTPVGPDGTISWDFGNTGGIASGAFTDMFDFVLPSDGTVTASVTSNYTKKSQQLKFTLVTLNGLPFTLTTAPGTNGGYSGYLDMSAGPAKVIVKGTSPGVAFSYTGNISFSPNAVPEPATWSLMITGFGGAGAMLRRRRAGAALA